MKRNSLAFSRKKDYIFMEHLRYSQDKSHNGVLMSGLRKYVIITTTAEYSSPWFLSTLVTCSGDNQDTIIVGSNGSENYCHYHLVIQTGSDN
jgi:hypothetical protein